MGGGNEPSKRCAHPRLDISQESSSSQKEDSGQM
eukprot:CAMPEP_0204582316 /NCGR_PEP_ID=MMETSP0661-20131031/45153_1 /ASSEMBLY_ACC=CAM_ASM_000606 /TAXON_ID=109239 /ORGANISM="Alexandrium margalefi, Strain AMGDE01CS-322" /LENGTH=33 /DNA_ID= /DNA_START= /DNA_END= /DNA_ORIENTATION=